MNYTFTVRGFTAGQHAEVLWEDAPFGLHLPTPDTSDLALPGHGSVAGMDRVRYRPVKFPLLVNEADSEDAEAILEELKAAWVYSDEDIALELEMAGTPRRYYGRTRGLEVDLAYVHQGVITGIVANFDALDPWGYTEAVTVDADVSSPITLTNTGNIATARVAITIVGNGGTPVITNTTAGGSITFRVPLANLATRTLNLRTFDCEDATNHNDEIEPTSPWFHLVPGDNVITFTGCTSVAASIESAYL